MSTNTSTVSSGSAILANQYNNLRKDISKGQLVVDTTSGANSAYSATITQIASYSVGQPVVFKANHTNTGSSTLNISSLGAKTIKKAVFGSTSNLEADDILSGQICKCIYDGTNFQMVSKTYDLSTSDKKAIGGDANGNTAHYHERKFGIRANESIANTTDSMTIAHGLSVTPKWVKVHAGLNNGVSLAESDGISDGTSYATIFTYQQSAAIATNPGIATENTKIIRLYDQESNFTVDATCSIDSTNINFSFTNDKGSAQTIQVKWEAGIT